MTSNDSVSELLDATSLELRMAREAGKLFISSAAAGDLEGMEQAREYLGLGGWTRAMRGVARLRGVPDITRRYFLSVWLDGGNRIRGGVSSDLVLVAGLRLLLPSYDGPPVLLYRGEGARNHRRRTYGLSWTSSRTIAAAFALQDRWRYTAGGSVLLETLAPSEAIICSSNEFQEEEYLVDRRLLRKVSVLERFDQARLAVPLDRAASSSVSLAAGDENECPG